MRTRVPHITLGTLRTLWAGVAFCSRWTLLPLWASLAGLACIALWAFQSSELLLREIAVGESVTFRARVALLTPWSGLSLCSGITLRPLNALRALRAGVSGVTFWPLWPLDALLSPVPFGPLRSLVPGITLGSLGPYLTSLTSRALQPGCPLRSGCARVTLGPLGACLACIAFRALRTSRARDRSGLNYVDDLLIHAWGRVLRGLSRLSTACNADRLLGVDGWCGDVTRYAIHAHPQEGTRNQALVGDRTGITRKQNLAGGNVPEGVRPKDRGLCVAVPRVVKYKLRTILVDSTGDECFSLRKGNHLANNL